MTVLHINHVEIKSLELLVNRIRIVDFLERSVDLKVIVIYDHAQVIELLCACEQGCLPYLALLYLAVADQCIYAVILVLKFCCQRHADRAGNTLSQGS